MDMTIQQIIILIKSNRLHEFYNDGAWKRLAAAVRREQNYECQHCKAMGKHCAASIVHHVNRIREHPELAYNRTYVDEHGIEHRNLILLCHQCHEEEHKSERHKFSSEKFNFQNNERW